MILAPATAPTPLALWGGAECTVNRVGDRWFDQLARTAPADGARAIACLAGLGVRALRIPVLWERVATRCDDTAYDWRASDAQLAACAYHGIEPIVGLLHHGSGPVGTDLLDPRFALHFARYADAVARRYRHVLRWTPVNEPVTTARFSALYGHWYPHRRDDDAFVRALAHQAEATVRAMAAIRMHVPEAELVQTEDLGRATGSPALAAQCAWENARRWFGLDLICGTVVDAHPLRLLCAADLQPRLDWLAAQPCVPALVGINHYLTSNRHLDDRVGAFPGIVVGGNGRQRYVDVEAVRVHGVEPARIADLLDEAWRRLRVPVALTEVQLACDQPVEQARWLRHAWREALVARARGVDVRAVTAWGLFGQVDWHCLVTRDEGRHVAGVFDRDGTCVNDTLASTLRHLAADGDADAPDDGAGGWWQSPARHRYFPDHPDPVESHALAEAA